MSDEYDLSVLPDKPQQTFDLSQLPDQPGAPVDIADPTYNEVALAPGATRDRDAAPASNFGPSATNGIDPDLEAQCFKNIRRWSERDPWWEAEKEAEIPITREKLVEGAFPEIKDKIASLEQIHDGEPLISIYGNPIDAAMASGYYMRQRTGPEDEEWGTMGWPYGGGYAFVGANTSNSKRDSKPWESRKNWDKIDPGTRWDETFRAHTHGLRNTAEGSMHFSPEDYDTINRGVMEYMVNSRGEHRFLFPGSGDYHVYVITLPGNPR